MPRHKHDHTIFLGRFYDMARQKWYKNYQCACGDEKQVWE
jgi:hypothetical protein